MINEHVGNDYKALKKNIQAMRGRGLSFQAIADAFNLWMILTRAGHGQWYSKTIRELVTY